MALTLSKYSNATLLMATGRLDLRSANIKLALLTAAYTPDMDDHTVFADVSEHEIDEYSNHTPGGETIPSLTVVRTGAVTKWDGGSVTFDGLDGEFKYGVLYYNGTVGTGPDEVEDPLIALVDFDDTTTETTITIPGADFLVFWNAEGIMDLGPCAEVCT
jgi:hypothetical protein